MKLWSPQIGWFFVFFVFFNLRALGDENIHSRINNVHYLGLVTSFPKELTFGSQSALFKLVHLDILYVTTPVLQRFKKIVLILNI
jgi:hypothetical protein